MKLPAWLPTRLNNLIARLAIRFTGEPYAANRDGRLTPLDEWDGYDSCMRPGCGHYNCEHSLGEIWETIHVNPALKEPSFKVGDTVSYPVGCMNGGCKCDKFWTVSDLAAWSQHLSAARANSASDLSQVPGVIDVGSDVSTTVCVTTYTESREATVRDVIYEEERILHHKYPGVLFDFHISWNKPPAG